MKTTLSAIAVAMVFTGTLAGCATPSSSGPTVSRAAPVDCHWPVGTKYPNSCAAASRTTPTSSGITAASFGKKACPWPNGAKNPNFC